jgi:hypothetical protein
MELDRPPFFSLTGDAFILAGTFLPVANRPLKAAANLL